MGALRINCQRCAFTRLSVPPSFLESSLSCFAVVIVPWHEGHMSFSLFLLKTWDRHKLAWDSCRIFGKRLLLGASFFSMVQDSGHAFDLESLQVKVGTGSVFASTCVYSLLICKRFPACGVFVHSVICSLVVELVLGAYAARRCLGSRVEYYTQSLASVILRHMCLFSNWKFLNKKR